MTSHVEQDVQMTNEKSVVNPYANPNSAGKTVDPGIFNICIDLVSVS